MAGELGTADLRSMARMETAGAGSADTVGLVFPVHMWGVPAPVLNFLHKLEKHPDTYYFAVAVNAGQVFLCNAHSSAVSPVRKVDKDVGEDVITASCNPWHEVIGDPVLVPSPFLAALPALPAILSHCTILSREL